MLTQIIELLFKFSESDQLYGHMSVNLRHLVTDLFRRSFPASLGMCTQLLPVSLVVAYVEQR
jgi:hypothetical protein